jgi:hypothetical protein
MRSKLILAAAAVAALIVATPVSVQWADGSLSLTVDKAEAVVGRPGTPRSVAGVARRTTRRTVRRAAYGTAAVGAAYGYRRLYGTTAGCTCH